MNEEWREVIFDPRYEVSSLGRVRKGDKILKQNREREGYMRVSIGGKHKRVHRLVAEAFLERKHSDDVVNHINGRKDDNRLTNLEYCTPRLNSVFAGKNGQLKGGIRPQKILAINIKTDTKAFYESQADASRRLHINDSEINKCLKGKRLTCHGYRFFYLVDYDKESLGEGLLEQENGQLFFI